MILRAYATVNSPSEHRFPFYNDFLSVKCLKYPIITIWLPLHLANGEFLLHEYL